MGDIQIVEVKTRAQLKEFVKFTNALYSDSPHFVPSLFSDEMSYWDAQKNPALLFSEAKQFLAYKEGKIAGKIAVMINHEEEKQMGIRKVRFGNIDFIDDTAVSSALLTTAINFARERDVHKIEGPMGFTNLDKAGVLTMGFGRLATMIGIYNHSYYPEHFEKFGLRKEKEWVEFEIEFPEVIPGKITRFSEMVSEKYGLNVLKFRHKKELLPLVEPMFRLLDETYRELSTYTPITPEQIAHYKEKYFGFLDKDYVICIEDSDNKLIAFAITMPSYSKALQKANGNLFPFGWWHFLQATKKNDRANFYLIGIHPDYQRRGITSIIFKEIYDVFRKKGVKYLETNPELEENKNIQLLWQDYNPVNHKRRRTYSMEF